MAELIMLVGLPGSGKSYISEQYKKVGYAIHSSDALRDELLGDITEQDQNNMIFRVLHERVLSDLAKGKGVVYDATNLTYKKRKAFLNTIKCECKKTAVIAASSFTLCINQNKSRDRVVPVGVILNMKKNFQIPIYEEGWDNIEMVFNPNEDWDLHSQTERLLWLCGIDQENPHHTLTIGDHCLKCEENVSKVSNDDNLIKAALLHDIGKAETKTFYNMKREWSPIAHYYSHENVSAYSAMFILKNLGYSNEDILDICKLINYHMCAFDLTSEKSIKKFIEKVGLKDYERIMILHEADKTAK